MTARSDNMCIYTIDIFRVHTSKLKEWSHFLRLNYIFVVVFNHLLVLHRPVI